MRTTATPIDALEQCREHYAMLADLFSKLAAGEVVEVDGRPATYEDWAGEARAGMALCARMLGQSR